MPSIFVWKCENACENACKNACNSSDHVSSNHVPAGNDIITYYSGSNWFMQEYHVTNSFMYTNQYVVTNTNGSNLLIYDVVQMPTNWVGSDCLEIVKVPYKLHKKDDYGQLDQLGSWMRFISNNNLVAPAQRNEEYHAKEFELIRRWAKA